MIARIAVAVVGGLAAALCIAADTLPKSVPLDPPAASSIPAGALGDAIRRGLAVVVDTQNAAKGYLGNGLVCANCHIDAGRQAYASPLAGLTGLFPAYSSRSASVESLEQRINDCFLRSMNGRPLPSGSAEMIGLLAYIAWLSEGVPTGVQVQGRGFKDITAPAAVDPARGKTLFGAQCAACHGETGQGLKTAAGGYTFPPLWGDASFNDGAGMSRTSIAAAFIQTKMPLGRGGSLTDQQAFDIAAYITAQPRPHFPGNPNDWPAGGRPTDAQR